MGKRNPQDPDSDQNECNELFLDLEKKICERMGKVEEDTKKLRQRAHDFANEFQEIKLSVADLIEEKKMQDQVLKRHGEMATQTNEMVNEINTAILGGHDKPPGMAEQVRTLNSKDQRRSKVFWIIMTAALTQAVGVVVWLIHFVHTHS